MVTAFHSESKGREFEAHYLHSCTMKIRNVVSRDCHTSIYPLFLFYLCDNIA